MRALAQHDGVHVETTRTQGFNGAQRHADAAERTASHEHNGRTHGTQNVTLEPPFGCQRGHAAPAPSTRREPAKPRASEMTCAIVSSSLACNPSRWAATCGETRVE